MILVFGFLFGGILQYAKLNRYNVISGLATLDNLAVAKAIAVAIGIGAILLNIECYSLFDSNNKQAHRSFYYFPLSCRFVNRGNKQ